MGDIRRGMEVLFEERKRFTVIGLTGRTGSGCSTAAGILSSNFKSLSLSRDVFKEISDAEVLRYEIIENYLKENWTGFRVIRIKDILTTFLLEESPSTFIKFCAYHVKATKKELMAKFSSFMLGRLKQMHSLRKAVQKLILENKESSLCDEMVYQFYFEDLPSFTDNLKAYLDSINPIGFTTLYQTVGNNVRTSGSAYSDKFNPDKIFLLAQRTRAPIKVLRKRSLKDNSRVLVVIDSIKNPNEAKFFKERYSSFYLLAITADEEQRNKRLINDFGLNSKQIENISNIEYPKSLEGYRKFTSLNIQQCIQFSDIHINNNDVAGKNLSSLTWKLAKYVALVFHPGLVNPSADERLMQVAHVAKLNSGCISRQVGAVITDSDLSIKAIGWNDVPRGQTPCVLRSAISLLKNENGEIFSDYEKTDTRFREEFTTIFSSKIDKGQLLGCNLSFCFKDIKNFADGKENQVHTRALHAEENAFLQISKYGGAGIRGGCLYTTASPCELCAKKAYQLGIKTIVYVDPYPGISLEHILGSGRSRPVLRMFEGAIGRAYEQIFSPIMPNKDLVDLLIDIDIPSKKKLLENEIKLLRSQLEEKESTIKKLKGIS